MTNDELDKLEALCKAAATGPWMTFKDPLCVMATDPDDGEIYTVVAFNREYNRKKNAAFVAAADPPTVLSLISEVRRLTKIVEYMGEYMGDRVDDGCPPHMRMDRCQDFSTCGDCWLASEFGRDES